MKQIYLVRHGESEGNLLHIHQHANTPLSSSGQIQAKAVALKFANVQPAIIISSPCLRARQTAQAIADQNNLKIEINELLAEKSGPSELIGVSEESQRSKYIRNIHRKHFLSQSGTWQYSDEETANQFVKRAEAAFTFLTKRPEENIIAISHSLIIKMILSKILAPTADLKDLYNISQNFDLRNTSVSTVIFNKQKAKWQILCINDRSHLE